MANLGPGSMQIVKSQHTIEVKLGIIIMSTSFRPINRPANLCKADLNYASMKLWKEYPDLAVFPGSLLLADNRPDDATYPSSLLSAEQLGTVEPALSTAACRQGARLYKAEGTKLCACRPSQLVQAFMDILTQQLQGHSQPTYNLHALHSYARCSDCCRACCYRNDCTPEPVRWQQLQRHLKFLAIWPSSANCTASTNRCYRQHVPYDCMLHTLVWSTSLTLQTTLAFRTGCSSQVCFENGETVQAHFLASVSFM